MRSWVAVLAVAACGGTSPVGGGDDGPATGTSGPYFDKPMFFNRDVSGEAKAANSDALIASIRGAGGWGNGDLMQVDFSFSVLAAEPSTPKLAFTPNSDFYTPDCDMAEVPVPTGGSIEGESGYSCTTDGDCHLLVFDAAAGKLFEMYRANIDGAFSGGCLALWDTTRAYDDTLRGEQCTSADAAGYPIAPLLFTADEVAAGTIDHAIRFTIPNDRIQRGYVRPATHGTFTTGDAAAPPYGVHLRLRADYPVDTLPSTGAQVVARATTRAPGVASVLSSNDALRRRCAP